MTTPVLTIDAQQKNTLDAGFAAAFGGAPARYFSAPGRTEIGGNHTDHQRGRVLAAAVNLDTVAAVRENGTDLIRILSKGYPRCEINVKELTPKDEEINSTPALIRGVAVRFTQLGCEVKGFDAYCESTVLPGSGLSSSAAYEVLMGTIINHLFFDAKLSPAEVARIGQYAENVFFGKPCGLMDQTASAVGNLVTIDFFDKEHPVIQPVAFDFSTCGHALCIIDTGADHADLADKILTAWRGYTDESVGVIAFSDGQPHNTITPIARRRGEDYELDLVLRCNITTAEHPLGVFHPHVDKHHIKKENIGLIEVMGLAVLPSRLKKELTDLAKAAAEGKEITCDEALQKHALWLEGLKEKYTFTAENAMDILLQETGKVFAAVLEDAGVYKNTPEGRAATLSPPPLAMKQELLWSPIQTSPVCSFTRPTRCRP